MLSTKTQGALALVVLVGLLGVGTVVIGGGPDESGPAASIAATVDPASQTIDTDEKAHITGHVTAHEPLAEGSLVLELSPAGGTEATTVSSRELPSLDAGATTNVTFSVGGDDLASGTYRYGLDLADVTDPPGATGELVVRQPPTFAVLDVDSTTVVRDEILQVRTRVRNVGDYVGSDRVSVYVDGDGDGSVSASERRKTATVTLGSGEIDRLTFDLSTADLSPGTHSYRFETSDESLEGTARVLRPATLRIAAVEHPAEVRRGTTVPVSVRVRNDGDVAGSGAIAFDLRRTNSSTNRSVTIAADESIRANFSIETATLSRGNYSAFLRAPDGNATVPFRVLDGHFDVTDLEGQETVSLGADLEFDATVRNTGDATDTQSVEWQVDLDGDDRPESYNVSRNVTLGPGNRTTVSYAVPTGQRTSVLDPDGELAAGTYIHGVFSRDANATGTVVVETNVGTWSGGSSGSSSAGTADGAGSDSVSRDEIAQQKYGYYFEDLSEETKSQVGELHERQPFADGRPVTEVLTREEIAIRTYDVDESVGTPFDFSALNVSLQQQIEADFDAQFESETSDRVESWNELALERFGRDYDSLADERQREIRNAYLEQFQ